MHKGLHWALYQLWLQNIVHLRIRIRIKIYFLARRNLLWDILRLPSSRRAALGLYVILTVWRGRGANQPPYALLHTNSPRYALRHGNISIFTPTISPELWSVAQHWSSYPCSQHIFFCTKVCSPFELYVFKQLRLNLWVIVDRRAWHILSVSIMIILWHIAHILNKSTHYYDTILIDCTFARPISADSVNIYFKNDWAPFELLW